MAGTGTTVRIQEAGVGEPVLIHHVIPDAASRSRRTGGTQAIMLDSTPRARCIRDYLGQSSGVSAESLDHTGGVQQ
jgi:hypothetical protein